MVKTGNSLKFEWRIKSVLFVSMEGRIFHSWSSQGESSVMRVRLRVVKNPLRIRICPLWICTSPLWICISPLRIYALTHYKYALGGSDVYSTSTNEYSLLLMHICNGLMRICNGFFTTLSLTVNTELSPWELPLSIIVLSCRWGVIDPLLQR